MSDKAVRVNVKGRIQGVAYRASTQQKATRLGLTGYIRNVSGNEVEVLAQGTEDELSELIEFLEAGTTGAEIDEFDYDWIEPEEDHFRFTIKY
ncbi:MAG: acylphosphatase [Bacillota bacterium]|jgi:acylphosphatase